MRDVFWTWPAARVCTPVGLVDRGFAVDGLDLDPTFIRTARARCPEGTFRVADMRDFSLGERYDVVLSLFSAIGYARTLEGLHDTLGCMARHVRSGGLVLVQPWFEPGVLTHQWVMMLTGERDDLKVARVSRTLVQGRESVLEFEYLVGRPDGIERRTEEHRLGLFTSDQMKDAFRSAGLSVEHRRATDDDRGLYVGRPVGAD